MTAALDRLAAIEVAATDGPWEWHVYTPENRQRMFLDAKGRVYGHVLKIAWPELLKDADAEFIAASRAALPALLAVARAAEALEREFVARGELGASPEDVAMYLRIVRQALAALGDGRAAT